MQKFRIGIISTAEIAHKVVSAIQLTSTAEAYAVASRSLEKAEQWAKAHQIAIFYGSYEDLLNDPNVDGVYIPLPTKLKKEWTIKAALKKKHVLVEKPLPGEDSDVDLVEMIQACKDNQVQFLDGTMWLHSLRTKDLRAEIDKLVVKQVIASFTFKAPNQEWLHGGNGRTNKNQEPQGCLGDQGWYPAGAILFAYNYELPKYVRALKVVKNKVDTIIQVSGFLEFKDDRIAYLDCGVTQAHRNNVEIVGENSVIRIDDQVGGFGRSGNFNAYFENFIGGARFFVDDVQGKEEIKQTTPSNHTQLMIEQFAKLSKEVDYSWSDRSLATHRVLAALYRSAENNGAIIEL